MAEIPLTLGLSAIVDDADFDWLSQWGWHSRLGRRTAYAVRGVREPGMGQPQFIRMHRLIVGAQPGELVDHANRNGLDNRRANLRLCSVRQNAANAFRAPGKTLFRGVRIWGRRYCARITVDNRVIQLGSARTPEEAARLYDEGARKYHGEFATLNFPDQERAA